MIALFQKEIANFFSSLMGYLVMGIFLLITALFLFVIPSNYNLLEYGYATLDGFFNLAPMIFLFLVPAICMRSFSDEKKLGTLELLFTSPLTPLHIILAKFLASLALLLISLIPTGVFVYTIQQLSLIKGQVDMGGVWGSYFGLFWVGAAFCAVSLFLSSTTKNQVVAFILAVTVNALLFFGFDWMAPFFGQGELSVRSMGMFAHYSALSRGVIDLRDFVYFLSLILLFLALCWGNLQRGRKTMRALGLRTISLFVLLLALNLLLQKVSLRWDLTSEKRYTLHHTAKKMIREVENVVLFKVYLAGDLPAGFKRLQNATRELLEDFQAYNRKIQFEFVNLYDIADEKSRQKAIQDLVKKGIQPTNLEVKEKGGVTRKLIFPAVEVSCQGKNDVIELLQAQAGTSSEEVLNTSIESLEYQLASSLYKIQQKQRKKVAFIDGHGELDAYHTVEAAYALGGFYEVERLRMNLNPATLLKMTDSGRIVPAYSVIVIAQPKERVHEVDKWAIDQYVMRGGRVLWFLDASNASLDSLRKYERQFAFEYPHNLSDMLFRYGVRINPNLILDLQSAPVPLITGYVGDQPQTEFFNYYLMPVLVSKEQHPVVRQLSAIRTEFVSVIDTLENAVQKTILLTTSPYTRTASLPAELSFDLLREEPNPRDFNKGELPVAVLLEGEFESAFKNRMAYGLENITLPFVGKSRENKMIVVSDGDMIKNGFNFNQGFPSPLGFDPYTQQTYANKAFVINCVHYLADGNLLLDLRGKSVKLRLLDRQRVDAERTYWAVLNSGLPLGLVVLFALLFLPLRKRKYRA